MSNRSQLEILALVVEAVGPADALRIVDPAAITDEAWGSLMEAAMQPYVDALKRAGLSYSGTPDSAIIRPVP